LAYLYENKGDVDKSIYYWKKRLALESDGTSKWMQKGRSKLDELEQRRKVREMMTEDDKVKYKKYRYENKRQRKFKDWIPEVGAKKLDEEMGQRYFDQGIKFYNNHKYDEALSSFRMARTFNVKGNDVNRYMVRINKVKKALAASDITGEEVYSSVVPREDLLLSRDHFKMGLDYYGQQDYERAFSSFTMAMTYNPYDEVIHRYVEDSKIKIEEEKVKGRQLKQDARRANVARSKQPLDVQRDMVRTREDMVNRGYITTSEDMSVESFMADGRELFLKKRYADALYVWKQAMLLDVAGLYREELESLLDQAEIETSKERDRRLDSEANVTEESLLADVTRAAIPSEKGISDWALRSHRKVARAVIGESLETKAIRKKLQIRYTLNFKDASLKGVVDLLTELTGLNIVIDTKEIGTNILNENNISFRVADMALIKILEAVLRFTDFDYFI
jgi:tetratricopeptide (TPR) repeat protein